MGERETKKPTRTTLSSWHAWLPWGNSSPCICQQKPIVNSDRSSNIERRSTKESIRSRARFVRGSSTTESRSMPVTRLGTHGEQRLTPFANHSRRALTKSSGKASSISNWRSLILLPSNSIVLSRSSKPLARTTRESNVCKLSPALDLKQPKS